MQTSLITKDLTLVVVTSKFSFFLLLFQLRSIDINLSFSFFKQLEEE